MKEENLDRANTIRERLTSLRLHLKDFDNYGVIAVKSATGTTLKITDIGRSGGIEVSEDSRVLITFIVTGPIRQEVEALEKELATL